MMSIAETAQQRSLLAALSNPANYPQPAKRVILLQTHISWIFLAGRYAYKIKKPVNFGFLDFSDLAKRQFFCREELRLNCRLAPSLYLDVVTLGGNPAAPVFGALPVFEYAVKIRRFAVGQTFDRLLARQRLTSAHLVRLAGLIGEFHCSLPPCHDPSLGKPSSILDSAVENFHQLLILAESERHAELQALQQRCQAEFLRWKPLFEQRQQQGMIRECHGDLHLGNIVLLRGQPTPFDGIEFNPALRWIDVISDVAFLVMDLQQHGRADLAWHFLDSYLQVTGDYAGLPLLPFYLAYRAMVRAKVAGLRATQGEAAAWTQAWRYLDLSRQMLAPRRPALIITHGLPGCGKSTLALSVVERSGAIRLRSDVERKRLFGLQATQNSREQGLAIYSRQATERTYRHLLQQAGLLLSSGFVVIIDAAFLRRDERRQFQALADRLAVPWLILSIDINDQLARQRLQQRQLCGDASEADFAVYQQLKVVAEPLDEAERDHALWVNSDDATTDWQWLDILLARLGLPR